MKPKFGREIALLTLPVLLIGGVAMWNGKIKSWSGFGAPHGLFEGKPRLEITDWKPETPSALDFARGISSRWKVTTWHGGVCPASGKAPSTGDFLSLQRLYFAWKRGNEWHQTPFQYTNSEFELRPNLLRKKPTKYETRLGLPLDLVPKDADEIHLRGRLQGILDCKGEYVIALSSPIDKLIKAPGQKWPQFAGSRLASFKLWGVEQKLLPQYSNVAGPSARWSVRATFAPLQKGQNFNLYVEKMKVTNAKGERFEGGSFTN